MSDIPEKAVEAAVSAWIESPGEHLRDWLAASIAAALPHLASAQPQPSKSDEEAARNLDVDLFWMRDTGNGDAREQLRGRPARLLLFRAFAEAARADERAAALDECEAIAREEESRRATMLRNSHAFFDNGAMVAASIIAAAIAALKRGPVAGNRSVKFTRNANGEVVIGGLTFKHYPDAPIAEESGE